jgi:hypothetical protein
MKINKMSARKILSHTKWFIAVFPLGIFAAITAPIFSPIAYLFRWLGVCNPFWFWLDDEVLDSKTNEDWLVYKTKYGKFAWYKWHAFRNTCWNLKNLPLFLPVSARVHCVWNIEQIQEILVDDLWRNNYRVNINESCIEMAALKYKGLPGQNPWQINSGSEVDFRYSTVGSAKLWYTAHGNLYYRSSTAEERVLTFIKFISEFPFIRIYRADGYYQFAMGASEKRYLFTLKRTEKNG